MSGPTGSNQIMSNQVKSSQGKSSQRQVKSCQIKSSQIKSYIHMLETENGNKDYDHSTIIVVIINI